MGQTKQIVELKSGHLRLIVRKCESFVYYATYVAGENNKLRFRKDDIVIDAGANIGDFTVKAARKVRDGRVIAIEPNPNNVEILKQNIILNKLDNVVVLPYGLSNVSGLAKLDGDSVDASIMNENENTIEIRTITINDIFKSYCPPDKEIVLKMDIEGAEELVFRDPSFLENVRELSMELHGKDNVTNISQLLQNLNYKIEYFSTKDQFKNTVMYIVRHPVSFFYAERKTGFTALKGLKQTLYGNNPVPSIGSTQIGMIYARKN